jgi:hypothetical protein
MFIQVCSNSSLQPYSQSSECKKLPTTPGGSGPESRRKKGQKWNFPFSSPGSAMKTKPSLP